MGHGNLHTKGILNKTGNTKWSLTLGHLTLPDPDNTPTWDENAFLYLLDLAHMNGRLDSEGQTWIILLS